MSDKAPDKKPAAPTKSTAQLLGDRRLKLKRLRDELKQDPYGQRTDGLIRLNAARDAFSQAADTAHKAAQEAAKEEGAAPADPNADERAVVAVAGRVVQHRVMGNLIFLSVRDDSGDLQIAVSKKTVGQPDFGLAKMTDYGDIVTAKGALGTTKTGEVTLWAGEGFEVGEDAPAYRILTKSLALPPGKHHGLTDPETRYRKRYVDLYANPEVMQTMQTRSRILKATRDYLTDDQPERGFLEVETPMMQAIPGGAAARPFETHHNALDIDLFLRIAPELYLKRLLVAGMPRVFEINRNFRNEGIDRSHNPEFTMLELYQAYGDLYSVMDLTENLFRHLASTVCGGTTLPFGEVQVDYAAFERRKYLDLFNQHNDFDHSDHAALVAKGDSLGLKTQDVDHDVLLNSVWEETVEQHLIQPTFVIDYPASLCPLTKRKPDEPEIAERFELFVCGMELANAYTELNDPDVQEANFKAQDTGLTGEDAVEAATFRNIDEDFLEALRVGMPPAGGLGIGIDRLVMLLTNQQSIRDVILFPLMRPQG